MSCFRLFKMLLLAGVIPGAAIGGPPNVILMMGDDHGWEETGYHGHPHVKTPVLDEMAANGLRLDRFYAAHPNCSPTRGSYLTGRHPNRYGTFAPGWSFRPEEITVARVLRQAGYRCAHFGKWHVGAVKASSPVNPGAMGFHEWLSHDNFFELNPALSRNGGPPEVFPGESSDILVRDATQFIDRARADSQPFFVIIWFGSPHEPYSGLPADLALYDDITTGYPKLVSGTSNETGAQARLPQGEILRARYAEITAMDRAIGRLRRHLSDTAVKHDTLLFYCGDNGTSKDAVVASPHRGAKGDIYDGGLLVPGLVEWPARIPRPRTTSIRATTSDLLPTICSLAGQSLPSRPIDGTDLVPLLDGRMTERPKPLYFWDFDMTAFAGTKLEPYFDPELQRGTTPLVKRQAGKLTRDFRNVRITSTTDAHFGGARAIIDGKYKLVIHDAKEGASKTELFDLDVDPAEQTSIAQQNSSIVEALQRQLREWQASVLHSLTGGDYAASR